ncbi:MAG: prepilin-type N-terminal cleavage/methylation domain-containing protein, partial [Clostridia bacterium]|nr:prepilin-type N-terminal cleavage/methylation domain-containing protein [Clostridia bacterium]
MNKVRRAKKGFTLIELMIVIVIIGILAAILIPTISNAIQKARLTSDKADCKNMNTILNTYFSAEIPDYLTAADVRNVVSADNPSYNFIPKTASDGYHYWYNAAKKEIQLLTADEIGALSRITGNAYADTDDYLTIDEIIPGYLFLDAGGSELATLLSSLKSISGVADYNSIFAITNNDATDSALREKAQIYLDSLKGLSESQKNALKTHIAKFDPNKTLYINDFGSFKGTLATANTIDHIVFSDGIVSIPAYAAQGVKTINSVVVLPITVRFVEEGAFAEVESVNGFVVRDFSVMRIFRPDALAADASAEEIAAAQAARSFSEYLERSLGSAIEEVKAMRSLAIADVTTLVSYGDQMTSSDGTIYLQQNVSIDPKVIVNQADSEYAGYDVGEMVVAETYKIRYSNNNIDDTITVSVKMFDSEGLLATTKITYKQVDSLTIGYENAVLTFNNAARQMYQNNDSAVAQLSSNMKYVIEIGSSSIEIDLADASGMIVSKTIGSSDERYTTLADAVTKITALYNNANALTGARTYTSAPLLSGSGASTALSFTYTFGASTAADKSPISGSTRTQNSSKTQFTRAYAYSIKAGTDTNAGKYCIVGTMSESGIQENKTATFYYMHDDKTNENAYDALLQKYSGLQYFNTFEYGSIDSTSLAAYADAITDGKLSVTVKLVDYTDSSNVVTILKKTEQIEVGAQSYVFSENTTGGQAAQYRYDFSNVPAYFTVGSNPSSIYGEGDYVLNYNYNVNGEQTPKDLPLITKSLTYYGESSSNPSEFTLSDSGLSVDGTTTYSNEKLVSKLESYVTARLISLGNEHTVQQLINSAYFIRNDAKSDNVSFVGFSSSITVFPRITDPYFLVLNLDTATAGTRTMYLVGLFDGTRDGDPVTTARVIPMEYTVVNDADENYDDIEAYRINGRYLYGSGTESMPFPVYASEVNNELFANGLTQINIAGNSVFNAAEIFNKFALTDDFTDKEKTFRTVVATWTETNGNAIADPSALTDGTIIKLTLEYFPSYHTKYGEVSIFCKVYQNAITEQLDTLNARNATTGDFYMYAGEGLGTMSNASFTSTIGTYIQSYNALNAYGSSDSSTLYQSYVKLTKDASNYYTIYTVRGDNWSDFGWTVSNNMLIDANNVQIAAVTGSRSAILNSDNTLKHSNKVLTGYSIAASNGTYYPYAPYYLTDDDINKYVMPSRTQCLMVIGSYADGALTYTVKAVDTNIAQNTTDSKYITNTNYKETNYWVDLDLAVGDYSASFELFQYNHFLTNPQYADVGYYYYASNTSRTAYENYIPVNHFKLDKTLCVVASDVLDDNLYNAVINNSNITSRSEERR